MADQDYGNCVECGNPLTEEELYSAVCDTVGDALDELELEAQMCVLALWAGRLISSFRAEDQKAVRRDLLKEIALETRNWNIAGCDA